MIFSSSCETFLRTRETFTDAIGIEAATWLRREREKQVDEEFSASARENEKAPNETPDGQHP